MLIRSLQKIRYITRGASICTIPNTLKSTCQVKPVEIVLKRNASIHKRSILIQKLKLEHINNFGVLLLVSLNRNISTNRFIFRHWNDDNL